MAPPYCPSKVRPTQSSRLHAGKAIHAEPCRALLDEAQTRHACIVRGTYFAGDGLLSQPVRETQGDSLEYIDQHVVVEGAVKLWFLGQCSLRALIEHDRGGVPVHR